MKIIKLILVTLLMLTLGACTSNDDKKTNVDSNNGGNNNTSGSVETKSKYMGMTFKEMAATLDIEDFDKTRMNQKGNKLYFIDRFLEVPIKMATLQEEFGIKFESYSDVLKPTVSKEHYSWKDVNFTDDVESVKIYWDVPRVSNKLNEEIAIEEGYLAQFLIHDIDEAYENDAYIGFSIPEELYATNASLEYLIEELGSPSKMYSFAEYYGVFVYNYDEFELSFWVSGYEKPWRVVSFSYSDDGTAY